MFFSFNTLAEGLLCPITFFNSNFKQFLSNALQRDMGAPDIIIIVIIVLAAVYGAIKGFMHQIGTLHGSCVAARSYAAFSARAWPTPLSMPVHSTHRYTA